LQVLLRFLHKGKKHKIYNFLQHSEKVQKWPTVQTISKWPNLNDLLAFKNPNGKDVVDVVVIAVCLYTDL